MVAQVYITMAMFSTVDHGSHEFMDSCWAGDGVKRSVESIMGDGSSCANYGGGRDKSSVAPLWIGGSLDALGPPAARCCD